MKHLCFKWNFMRAADWRLFQVLKKCIFISEAAYSCYWFVKMQVHVIFTLFITVIKEVTLFSLCFSAVHGGQNSWELCSAGKVISWKVLAFTSCVVSLRNVLFVVNKNINNWDQFCHFFPMSILWKWKDYILLKLLK